MFGKGLGLLIFGIIVVVIGIAVPVLTGGGLLWVLTFLTTILGGILCLTGVIVMKGPESIEKLAQKRNELK